MIRPLGAALLALSLFGCANQTYRPQPLEPARIAAELGERRNDDDGVRAFMERHGLAAKDWPLQKWNLQALTLMAVYFHPDMEVARINLDVRRAGVITAGQRPNPKGGPLLEHHSAAGNDIANSPWSLGLGLGIPIELGDKRIARIERAEQLSEEAKLAIAEAAWKVRSRLVQRSIDVYNAESESELSKRELDIRSQEAAMLERRQKAGEASPSEVTLARLQLQRIRLAVDGAEGNIRAARAGLAEALGLPFAEVEHMTLDFATFDAGKAAALPESAVQRAALQNRLDLRGALARYGAAEATLREEIAKQYPNLDLSPGLLWDQGDWIKSLGAVVLLPILNNNEGPIAEAEAKRKLEAVRFVSLEAGVFAELAAARVRYEASLRVLDTAKGLVSQQTARLEEIEKLIAFGEADRLSLVEAQIELIAAERAELVAKIAALRARSALEDAIQRPLEAGEAPEDLAAPPQARPASAEAPQ